MPSIFFGPPKSSRVLAWQRVLGESSFSQASLESKEDWPGGPLKDRSGAQALVPFLKRVHSSPFPSFPCLQAGRRGGALLPGKKGKGVGPAQAGKGWPPGRLQGGDPPLERPWTLPSFLCQRKVPKAGLPGKPQGSLRAAFVAFLPELS